ncbi:hypothetical protein ACFLYT_01120, partial [Nanoarchaeota archaeon]
STLHCPDVKNGGICTGGDIDFIGEICGEDSDCGTDGQCNVDQSDLDNDGDGDVCDPCTDYDNDGYGHPNFDISGCIGADNCLFTSNSDQLDIDNDGIGDACDADIDGDGIKNCGADNNCATIDDNDRCARQDASCPTTQTFNSLTGCCELTTPTITETTFSSLGCGLNEVPLFYTTGTESAHTTTTENDYSVCYPSTYFNVATCASNNQIFKLKEGHIQVPGFAGAEYTQDSVCLSSPMGDITCNYINYAYVDGCASNEVCIASISGDTSAHIAECDYYDTNVCCGIGSSNPVCGNNLLEDDEDCEDGNDKSGDGCSSDCKIEIPGSVCGNNVIEAGEECDDSTLNSDTIPDACRTDCKNARCGDNTIDTLEQCDDGDTFTSGCSYGQASCTVCDSQCQNVAGTIHYCGDGNVDSSDGGPGGEQCDPPDGSTCDNQCQNIITSLPGPARCGNKKMEAGEQCDTTDDAACPGQCIPAGQLNECTCPPSQPPPSDNPLPTSQCPTTGGLCSDGIWNCGESDQDCGGPCQPCPVQCGTTSMPATCEYCYDTSDCDSTNGYTCDFSNQVTSIPSGVSAATIRSYVPGNDAQQFPNSNSPYTQRQLIDMGGQCKIIQVGDT